MPYIITHKNKIPENKDGKILGDRRLFWSLLDGPEPDFWFTTDVYGSFITNDVLEKGGPDGTLYKCTHAPEGSWNDSRGSYTTTVFMVFEYGTTGGNHVYRYNQGTNNTQGQVNIYYDASDHSNRFVASYYAGVVPVGNSAQTAGSTQSYILNFQKSRQSSTVQSVDLFSSNGVTGSGTGSLAYNNISLCSQNDRSTWSPGSGVIEIVGYYRGLTQSPLNEVETYLKNKYNITY